MEQTIPKIIHYCWFGGKPLPPGLAECLETWRLLAGYERMRWDERNCSFDENPFVRSTFAQRQLGFIGDYYRLKALYEHGGVYLDTDVRINRSFDSLLHHPVFLNFIFDCSVGSAIIGAQPRSPFIKGLLDLYDATVFGKNESGAIFRQAGGQLVVDGYATSNYYYTHYILQHYPAFLLNNRYQDHGDFVIYPKELFEIGTLTGRHYAIHLCAGEWRDKTETGVPGRARLKAWLKKMPALYDRAQVLVRKRRYRALNKTLPFYPVQRAQQHGKGTAP